MEAVECLKLHYDSPCLVHQTHANMILEAPPLKEGTGREQCHLQKSVQQQVCALKAMNHESSGSFITTTIEIKLDPNTMFERQKHSQSSTDVFNYQELLDFISLQSQASENSIADYGKKQSRHESPPPIRKVYKPIASYATSADSSASLCLTYRTDKHLLYACPKFKLMPHEKKIATLKSNNLYMNCLESGHFVK